MNQPEYLSRSLAPRSLWQAKPWIAAAMAFACSCHALHGSTHDWLTLGLTPSQERYTAKFNDVEVVEFIQYVSRISGKNFSFKDPDLNFKISIVCDTSSSSDELLAMLLKILEMNGVTVLQEGNHILLSRQANINTQKPVQALPPVMEEGQSALKGLVTRVYKIRYASAGALAQIVTKLASDDSRVAVHPPTGQIIICDNMGNVERIEQLLQQLDQIDTTKEIEIYKVKHGNLAALKGSAEEVLRSFTPQQSAPESGSVGGTTTASTPSEPSAVAASLVIIPNIRSNSLFLVGTRQMIDRSIGVLNTLDVPSELESMAKAREMKFAGDLITEPARLLDPQINPEFYVYKLQNRQGGDILTALTALASSMQGSAREISVDSPLIQAITTLQWIESINCFLFSGDDASILKLRNLIQTLDTPVKQVFIEALILDTTISNAEAFSLEVGVPFLFDKIGLSLGNFSPNSTLSSDVINATTAGVIPTFASGFSAGVIGSIISHNGHRYGSIGSLITAMERDNDTRIVMNPKILVADKQPCQFFVGQNVRVKSGLVQNSGNNDVVSTNYETRDIGTKLDLVPTINSQDMVTIIIQQETSTALSDAINATDATAFVPLTSTSRTQTQLQVPNGHFVILSGMINDRRSDFSSRVPILGSLPLVGFLFRGDNKNYERRNLLFFIRPQVIQTQEELQQLNQRHMHLVQQGQMLSADLNRQSQFLPRTTSAELVSVSIDEDKHLKKGKKEKSNLSRRNQRYERRRLAQAKSNDRK